MERIVLKKTNLFQLFVEEHMKQQNLTMKDVSEETSIPLSLLSIFIKGERDIWLMGPDRIRLLANCLSCSVAELLIADGCFLQEDF